jgi:formylmethanofuran dehydrogenase subunit B
VRIGRRDASVDDALHAAAALLREASRPLVYLAPDISCEAQREAIALADVLRASIDSVTSATTMRSILAAQERGRAAATLGEIRNRADVMLFWGVDPALRYPRYWSRYAPEPEGVHVAGGRRGRTIVAADIGASRGPADADHRVAIAAADDVAALTRASAGEGELASLLRAGRYVAIVADAEPEAGRDHGRAAALLALAQALNAKTRCALSLLRAGGNRSGADACLTAQTGYPAAVDFARGFPIYRPYAVTTPDAVLIVGSASLIPAAVQAAFAGIACAVIGPRASDSALSTASVMIDTGVVGIHEAGTALRMDDVPLPLRVSVAGPREVTPLVAALRQRVTERAA